MAEMGAQARHAAVAGQGWRRWADEAPQHPQQHHTQQHQADTLVQVRRVFAPGAVVVEPDHPQPKREQTEDRQCHNPVNDDTDPAIAGGRVT
ncbi:hypothetical protein D9M69_596880 [compost metagenome]